MLSCLGSRRRAYPQIKTLHHTLHLILSMRPPKWGGRKTLGQIRSGLVAIVSACLRRFLLAVTSNRMVHVEWNSGKNAAFNPVAEDIKFPTRGPDNGAEALHHKIVTRSLSTLTRGARCPKYNALQILRTIQPGRDRREHTGRDARAPCFPDAAIPVEDDDDEALVVFVVSESCSHRSVEHLMVDVDPHDNGPAPVVVLQGMGV